MIKKQITIGDQVVSFGTSARTPRLYEQLFGKDVMDEMTSFYSNYQKALKDNGAENISDLAVDTQVKLMNKRVFENLAYTMAMQADPDIPSIDDWLDEFDQEDFTKALPEIMGLWGLGQKGRSVPKKK